MIGGYFERHPKGTPKATITVVDAKHPATAKLPKTITRNDEWYYYKDFDPTMRVLITVDPATIGEGEADVNPNPLVWCHDFGGGRVFYSGLGHTSENYSEPYMVDLLAGALEVRRRQVAAANKNARELRRLAGVLSVRDQESKFWSQYFSMRARMRGVRHAAAQGVEVVLEMRNLGHARNRDRDRRMRDHVFEEQLAPALRVDLRGPFGQVACPRRARTGCLRDAHRKAG